MSSVYGNLVKVGLFGESHSDVIGVVIDGFPHGVVIDLDFVKYELQRRSGGTNIATERAELDINNIEILSGVKGGVSTGSPVCAIIQNTNVRRSDYDNIADIPRPSHADYTAKIRYNGFNDHSGGGHLSGRLTAPLVFAGAVSKIALEKFFGIQITAHIKQIYDVKDKYPESRLPSYSAFLENHKKRLSVFDNDALALMIKRIEYARENQNSIGGIVTLVAFGVEAGFGSPIFSSIESNLSSALFSIPGVKGVEFGLGFDFVNYFGSEVNDAFVLGDNKKVETLSNNNGGINGGISNGMQITANVVLKPTPSIATLQKTLNIKTMQTDLLTIKGRHDPCIAIRAIVALESAMAIAILNIAMEMKGRNFG